VLLTLSEGTRVSCASLVVTFVFPLVGNVTLLALRLGADLVSLGW